MLNVVPLVSQNGSCHYNSFIFPDFFLKFYRFFPPETTVQKRIAAACGDPLYMSYSLLFR